MLFYKGEIFCTYSVTKVQIGLVYYLLVDIVWNCSETTLHIGDTNEVTRFIVSADLLLFLPIVSGEMVGITVNSSHVLQTHRKKPLCAII